MADKITLNTLASLANQAGFLNQLNENFTLIANKIDTLVSRDGDSPNQISAPLDMNGQRLINLPAPQTDTEPLRRGDVIEGSVIGYVAAAEQAALDAQQAVTAAQQAAEDAQDILDLIGTPAGLDSPAFTGTPTVPTPGPSDDSTQIANTAWVVDYLSAFSVPDADETVAGKVEIATPVEVATKATGNKVLNGENVAYSPFVLVTAGGAPGTSSTSYPVSLTPNSGSLNTASVEKISQGRYKVTLATAADSAGSLFPVVTPIRSAGIPRFTACLVDVAADFFTVEFRSGGGDLDNPLGFHWVAGGLLENTP